MFDDDIDSEIIDIEASKEAEKEELEKENHPIRQKFRHVKASHHKVYCLVSMLINALNNEFDEIENDEILDYINLIEEHLEMHEKILDKFFNDLNIPNKPAKLINLKYTKFKD